MKFYKIHSGNHFICVKFCSENVRGAVPNRNLLAQNQQWKDQSNVWSLFKVKHSLLLIVNKLHTVF